MSDFVYLVICLLAAAAFGVLYRLRIYPKVTRVIGVLFVLGAIYYFTVACDNGTIHAVSEWIAIPITHTVQWFDQHTRSVQLLLRSLERMIRGIDRVDFWLENLQNILEVLMVIIAVAALLFHFIGGKRK